MRYMDSGLIKKQIKKSSGLYILFFPVLLYFIVFKYWPMEGLIIAFKKYNVVRGVWGSPWVGLRNFLDFFGSVYSWRVVRNTVMLNLYGLVFGFPAPIILAIMLNEMKSNSFRRWIQTISYLPHFVSVVIAASMATQFLSPMNGVANNMLEAVGLERIYFLSKSELFRPIYTSIEIWRGIGWGSIIYLAAIIGIDSQLYEAAIIDGAGRWQRILNVTLPSLVPTMVVVFILRIGNFLEVGFEMILLLYNTNIYETADVIETFVYRYGLLSNNFSYATAAGLFQSLVGLLLVVAANAMSKRYASNGLW